VALDLLTGSTVMHDFVSEGGAVAVFDSGFHAEPLRSRKEATTS
jgi:hypothetical protein